MTWKQENEQKHTTTLIIAHKNHLQLYKRSMKTKTSVFGIWFAIFNVNKWVTVLADKMQNPENCCHKTLKHTIVSFALHSNRSQSKLNKQSISFERPLFLIHSFFEDGTFLPCLSFRATAKKRPKTCIINST